jgi:hypothetical protein
MSKSKIMKVFHQYNKDYLLSCGFTKVNDVYVKIIAGERLSDDRKSMGSWWWLSSILQY